MEMLFLILIGWLVASVLIGLLAGRCISRMFADASPECMEHSTEVSGQKVTARRRILAKVSSSRSTV